MNNDAFNERETRPRTFGKAGPAGRGIRKNNSKNGWNPSKGVGRKAAGGGYERAARVDARLEQPLKPFLLPDSPYP